MYLQWERFHLTTCSGVRRCMSRGITSCYLLPQCERRQTEINEWEDLSFIIVNCPLPMSTNDLHKKRKVPRVHDMVELRFKYSVNIRQGDTSIRISWILAKYTYRVTFKLCTRLRFHSYVTFHLAVLSFNLDWLFTSRENREPWITLPYLHMSTF